MEGLEVIDIIGVKENLLDERWLFNNIPWSNHDGKYARVILDKPTDLYYIQLNGFDTQSAEIKKCIFDSVDIIATHATVNHYEFTFKLNGVVVLIIDDNLSFGYNPNDVRQSYISILERKITGYNWHIEYSRKAIQNLILKS